MCVLGGGDIRTGVPVACTGTPNGDGGLRGTRGREPIRSRDGDGHECVVRGVVSGNSRNHGRTVEAEYEGGSSRDAAGMMGATRATNESAEGWGRMGDGGAQLTVADGAQ